jgi:hypothetical protein
MLLLLSPLSLGAVRRSQVWTRETKRLRCMGLEPMTFLTIRDRVKLEIDH